MCIACELAFLDMLDALPAEERERVLRREAATQGGAAQRKPAAPFVCAPFDEGSPADDERKP
jgi:hypothetical protein